MTKTTIKTTGVVITKKTNKFTLLARPEIAPKGLQPGLITDVLNVTGTENGTEFNRMEIVVQLDAKDRSNKNFVLTKTYNIGANGRGIALFIKDYSSMTGTELSKTDLYDFNPETMKNSRVVAEVDYTDGAKGVVSAIQTFHQAEVAQSTTA